MGGTVAAVSNIAVAPIAPTQFVAYRDERAYLRSASQIRSALEILVGETVSEEERASWSGVASRKARAEQMRQAFALPRLREDRA